ncbi:hypothetical protein [Vibrio parahaemolyticus]|uniref:hypothetical protein n=1 Tax=Vibrio parahaemolyticus TaxID=670 RepID=UPI002152F33A
MLRNYQLRHELHTLTEIIHRFALPNENHTANYARFVAGRVGVGMDERIDLVNNKPLLVEVLHAPPLQQTHGAERRQSGLRRNTTCLNVPH